MQELVKENVFIIVFELVSCDEGHTQDEKTRIRKFKHGGNMWLRCGNTAQTRVSISEYITLFHVSVLAPWSLVRK